MTQLELVISEIEKLPPAEQNQFAAWILEELHSEKRWSKLFDESSDELSSLADEALAEHISLRRRSDEGQRVQRILIPRVDG